MRINELLALLGETPDSTSEFSVVTLTQEEFVEYNELFEAFAWPFTLAATDFDPWSCAECDKCRLSGGPKVVVSGNMSAKYMFVGIAPGATSPIDSVSPMYALAWQFGPSSRILKSALKDLGVYDECCFTNLMKCPVPYNRRPTIEEVASCAVFIERELEAIQPEIIIGMGRAACELGHWVGFNRTIKHPAYFLRIGQPDLLKDEITKKVLR